MGVFGAPASPVAVHYVHDANGNVAGVNYSADNSPAAVYTYDPYGNTVHSSGDLAAMNPFRFSSKYCDVETGLYDYGYRFYKPDMGRWISRDPIGEQGGYNLYEFLWNTSVNSVDPYGLFGWGPDYERKSDDGSVTIVVKKCHIVIYLADASLLHDIENEPCSAASTVSCDPAAYRPEGPITIEIPLTGWEPIRHPMPNPDRPVRAYDGLKTDDTSSPVDAVDVALQDFQMAIDKDSVDICNAKEKCCDKVDIEISCDYLQPLNKWSISGVCGKSFTRKCE